MADTIPDIEQAHDSGITSNPLKEGNVAAEEALEPQLEDFKNIEAERVVVLSFRSLQLRRIAELQDKLLNLAIITASGSRLPVGHTAAVDRALRDFAEALRNYETLSSNALATIPPGATLIGSLASSGAEPPPRSFLTRLALKFTLLIFGPNYFSTLGPFKHLADLAIQLSPLGASAAVWGAVRYVVSSNDTGITPSNIVETMQLAAGNLGFRELDQKGRALRAQKRAFTERVLMAMFGGVALIAPMLVMTLYPSRNTSLITVSVATFVFAIALAFGATDSGGKDVLAATAAYAAVLVVFVGTSTPTPQ